MIHAKVAETLDRFTVVLNVGLADGVERHMEFVIYEEGPEITDPESGESLGALELVKGRVTVTDVQKQVSVARAETKTISKPSTIYELAMNDLLVPDMFGTRTEVIPDGFRIKVENEVKVEKLVRVGDLAHSVSDIEEFE